MIPYHLLLLIGGDDGFAATAVPEAVWWPPVIAVEGAFSSVAVNVGSPVTGSQDGFGTFGGNAVIVINAGVNALELSGGGLQATLIGSAGGFSATQPKYHATIEGGAMLASVEGAAVRGKSIGGFGA